MVRILTAWQRKKGEDGEGVGKGGEYCYVLFYFKEGTDASHKLILYCNVSVSRPIGSDIEAGELVLSPGTLLGAAEVGVLAAVGATVVTVSSLPRVAVLSTGGEGGGRHSRRWRHCRNSHLPTPRRRPRNR